MDVGNELINLDASVNTILLSVVKRIGDLEIEPNETTLQMEEKT